MITIAFSQQTQPDKFAEVKNNLCSQFYFEQKHYLRMPVIYDSAKLDLLVIDTMKQIKEPAAIFVYQDSELDPELDSDGRVVESFFQLKATKSPPKSRKK